MEEFLKTAYSVAGSLLHRPTTSKAASIRRSSSGNFRHMIFGFIFFDEYRGRFALEV